jgi:hypothetical protein
MNDYAVIKGNCGQADSSAQGQQFAISLGRSGEMLVSELRARFDEATRRGVKFSATFTAAATAAATTSALCVIMNPPGSGKMLVFQDAFVALTAYTAQTLAGSSVALGGFLAATIPSTVGSAVTPVNCNIGGPSNSVAKAWASATVGVAPVVVRQLAAWALGTATPGADVVGGIHDDISGAVQLSPGYGIAIFGLGGTPADLTIQPTLTWDEVPIAQVP